MRDGGIRAIPAVLMLAVAACAPMPPSPSPSPSAARSTDIPPPSASAAPSSGSAILIVTQAFTGEGWYTEGAYAYVELSDATGAVVERVETTEYRVEQELARFVIDAGRYELRSYVRSCNGACEALAPPSEACDAMLDLRSGEERSVRIERTLRRCEVRSP